MLKRRPTYRPTLTNNTFVAPHAGAQQDTIFITFYSPIDPAKRPPLMRSDCLIQISNEPGQSYAETVKFPPETVCIRTHLEDIVAGVKDMSIYEQPGRHIWLHTSLIKYNDEGKVIALVDELTVIW
jgi:hypothetical protein